MGCRAGLAILVMAMFLSGGTRLASADPGPCEAPGSCRPLSATFFDNDTLPVGKYLIGRVSIENGATLTIPAGTSLYFGPDSSLDVGVFLPGRLVVAGTRERPVLMTSALANPVPGSWRGLDFRDGEGSFRYARIEFAETAIRLLGSTVEMSNGKIVMSNEGVIGSGAV